MTFLGALSALWTITTVLYNIIDKVKGNTEEYKGTLNLVHSFLEDVLQSDIQSVSPAMQERITGLLRTFATIKADMTLLEQRSLVSRTIFHEDVAAKLRWVRREVDDARKELLFRVQLERFGHDLRRGTYSSGQGCGFMSSHRTCNGLSAGDGGVIQNSTPAPLAVHNAPSRHSDQLARRTPARRGHVKRFWSMWRKERPELKDDSGQDNAEVNVQYRPKRDRLSHSDRPQGRPRSTIVALPNSRQRSTASYAQPRRPMSANYGERSSKAHGEGDVSWREPCTTLLNFTDNELSEGLGLPTSPQGAKALRKHLKLLADSDSAMEQSLLRAWYAVDRRRRVTGVQALQ